MTNVQFTTAIAKANNLDVNDVNIITSEDLMCAYYRDINTYYIDNGNGEVVSLANLQDTSEEWAYSIFEVKEQGFDCAILHLNRSISGVGNDGSFGVWTSKEEIVNFIKETRVNN